jgi:hypothetical protein
VAVGVYGGLVDIDQGSAARDVDQVHPSTDTEDRNTASDSLASKRSLNLVAFLVGISSRQRVGRVCKDNVLTTCEKKAITPREDQFRFVQPLKCDKNNSATDLFDTLNVGGKDTVGIL